MAKFITLTAVASEDKNEEGLVVNTTTMPMLVNVDDVRSAHPRKHGLSGTRIVFKNGSAQPVTDEYDAVAGLLTA